MLRRVYVAVASALLAISLIATATSASAADIKILSGGAMQPALADLIPTFEKSSGHKVTIDYGSVGSMVDRLQKGEAADVIIVTPAQIEALQKQSKVVTGSRSDLAKVGIGVFMRKGISKPDIGSVEAFKSALLAAKSISYPAPSSGSPIGAYLPGAFEKLGIADQLMPKTNLSFNKPSERFDAVAKGDLELGFAQMTEIVAASNVDLVGPLPAAIQSYTAFSAGIVANSQQLDAAKAFVRFISSPAALAVMKAKGFEVSDRGASAGDNGLITKPSNYSVQETVDRFEAAVKARGQVVFGEIDHAAAAAKVGLQLQPRLVVMFGRPQNGTAAIRQAPTLGIDAPMKAVIWQDDQGKVWLTYNSAEYQGNYIYPRHGLPPLSAEARKNLEQFLQEVTDQATK